MPWLRSLVLAWSIGAAVAAGVVRSAADPPRSLPSADPATVGFAPDRLNRLNEAMHRAVDDGEVAGVLTLLARHGKVVSVDGYGRNSIASGTPLQRDGIFRMYSQTKPITGVAMMMLFEQAKWSFDDPVSKYVPEFADLKVFDGLEPTGQPKLVSMDHPPTMRMLMTHTAGFGYGYGPFAADYVDGKIQGVGVFRSSNLHEMVQRLATVPLRLQPGTRWWYSAAADIQGYIVEKLTGQRFGDYLAEHLFVPLGMRDTAFYVPAEKAARLVSFYAMDPKTRRLAELDPVRNPALQDFAKVPAIESGGAGLVSTIDDYARFCQMLLDGGVLDGQRVLAPATVAMIGTDQLPADVAPEQTDYGAPIGGSDLGFGIDVAVMKHPAHMGKLAGVGTYYWGGAGGTWFWIDPKNDLFFVGMIQRYDGGDDGFTNLDAESQTLVYAALLDPSA